MISREICQRVLHKAVSTGADYAEIFAENTVNHSISMIASKVESVKDAVIAGAAVRVYKGLRSVMASTVDTSESGLLACAEKAAEALGQGDAQIEIVLRERLFGDIHPVKIVPSTVGNARKVEILKAAYFAAREYDASVVQAPAAFWMWITTSSSPIPRGCMPRTARSAPVWPSLPWQTRVPAPRQAPALPDGEWAWKCSTPLIPKMWASRPPSRLSPWPAQATAPQA